MGTVDTNQLAITFRSAEVGRSYYLFNTDVVAADPAIFVRPANARPPPGAAGRGSVQMATVNNLEVVIKSYHRGGLMQYLSADLYRYSGVQSSRVWRELQLLAIMYQQGLPSPLPVAGRLTRVARLWYRAQLITRHIPAQATLGDWLAGEVLCAAQWQALAATLNRFHRVGVCHADLNAHNILIDHQHNFHLIDFDKGRIAHGNAAVRRQRNSLERLQRSLIKLQKANPQLNFSAADWHHFMAAIEIG